MPRVDIWIRKDDMSAWEAIEDKPQFLHTVLKGDSILVPRNIIKTPQDALKAVTALKPVSTSKKFCVHGHLLGECTHKEKNRKCMP